MIDFLVPLAGFLVGSVVGMSGVGGGSLTTSMLILFADVRPILAVSADLMYATLTRRG